VLEQLDPVDSHPRYHNSGGVYHSIAPVEKSLLGHHFQLLLPQMLQEGAQGLHNVVCVDLRPHGDIVSVDKAPTIKEGKQHLLGAASLDLNLMGPGFSLLNPLFRLLSSLWSVVTDHHFVLSLLGCCLTSPVTGGGRQR
jgi:hypothetical protein